MATCTIARLRAETGGGVFSALITARAASFQRKTTSRSAARRSETLSRGCSAGAGTIKTGAPGGGEGISPGIWLGTVPSDTSKMRLFTRNPPYRRLGYAFHFSFQL